MKPQDFEKELRKTLEDQRLSRGEKRALQALVADADGNSLAMLRNIAFRIAKEEADEGERTQAVISWLEDVLKALVPPEKDEEAPNSQAFFSPGDGPLRKIIGLLTSARKTCDICVFTITDDRIVEAIFSAHKRGVKLRVITDDEKSEDLGSDVARIERAGIPVTTDQSRHHMHHKFALFDRKLLLTGSYNWTRSAANKNQENVIITSDPRLVNPFIETFDNLWLELG